MTHAPLKVLLVDDDRAIRKIYGRYLMTEGFTVLEAADGEQAVIDFAKEDLDIILLDLRLPEGSGQILAPSLRKFHPRAKIIVSSCYDTEEQKDILHGADGYFDKSDGCHALLAKIKSIIPDGNRL